MERNTNSLHVGLCQRREIKVKMRDGMRQVAPWDFFCPPVTKQLTRSCLAPDFSALNGSQVREQLPQAPVSPPWEPGLRCVKLGYTGQGKHPCEGVPTACGPGQTVTLKFLSLGHLPALWPLATNLPPAVARAPPLSLSGG